MELEKQGLIADKRTELCLQVAKEQEVFQALCQNLNSNRLREFTSYVHSGVGKYVDLNAIGMSKFSSALLVQKLATFNNGMRVRMVLART